MNTIQHVLVAARDNLGVIGHDLRLPWHLPEDLKQFKNYTLNQPILMGRKTWQSLGKPLPKRLNLVLTRSQPEDLQPLSRLNSLDEKSLEQLLGQVYWVDDFEQLDSQLLALGFDRCVTIGGGEIYTLMLPKVSQMRLTEVDASVDGNIYFPAFNQDDFSCLKIMDYAKDHQHAFNFRINEWNKRG
jgi:dihydrofolate reductase